MTRYFCQGTSIFSKRSGNICQEEQQYKFIQVSTVLQEDFELLWASQLHWACLPSMEEVLK